MLPELVDRIKKLERAVGGDGEAAEAQGEKREG
jgi:hypothetical protein